MFLCKVYIYIYIYIYLIIQTHCTIMFDNYSLIIIIKITYYSFNLLISSGRKSILREAIRRTSDGVNRQAIASAPQ